MFKKNRLNFVSASSYPEAKGELDLNLIELVKAQSSVDEITETAEATKITEPENTVEIPVQENLPSKDIPDSVDSTTSTTDLNSDINNEEIADSLQADSNSSDSHTHRKHDKHHHSGVKHKHGKKHHADLEENNFLSETKSEPIAEKNSNENEEDIDLDLDMIEDVDEIEGDDTTKE